jgi:hypothetical protein
MTRLVTAAIRKPGWKQKFGRVTPGLVNLLPYGPLHERINMMIDLEFASQLPLLHGANGKAQTASPMP